MSQLRGAIYAGVATIVATLSVTLILFYSWLLLRLQLGSPASAYFLLRAAIGLSGIAASLMGLVSALHFWKRDTGKAAMLLIVSIVLHIAVNGYVLFFQ